MTTSFITKKRIAKAFKKELNQKPFEKISVVDIMEEAAIRRQTFYNHFLDKHDLLDWIFKTELQEQITDNLNYISGFHLLKEVLLYFDNNVSFYREIFLINDQNDFSSYFLDYCLVLTRKIMKEFLEGKSYQVSEIALDVMIHYHAQALMQLVKWSLLTHHTINLNPNLIYHQMISPLTHDQEYLW